MKPSMYKNVTRGQAFVLLCILTLVAATFVIALIRGPATPYVWMCLAAVLTPALWACVRVIADRDLALLRVPAVALTLLMLLPFFLLFWPFFFELCVWLTSDDG